MWPFDDSFSRRLVCSVRFALTGRGPWAAALSLPDKSVFQRGPYCNPPPSRCKTDECFSPSFLTAVLVKHPAQHRTGLLWVLSPDLTAMMVSDSVVLTQPSTAGTYPSATAPPCSQHTVGHQLLLKALRFFVLRFKGTRRVYGFKPVLLNTLEHVDVEHCYHLVAVQAISYCSQKTSTRVLQPLRPPKAASASQLSSAFTCVHNHRRTRALRANNPDMFSVLF